VQVNLLYLEDFHQHPVSAVWFE